MNAENVLLGKFTWSVSPLYWRQCIVHHGRQQSLASNGKCLFRHRILLWIEVQVAFMWKCESSLSCPVDRHDKTPLQYLLDMMLFFWRARFFSCKNVQKPADLDIIFKTNPNGAFWSRHDGCIQPETNCRKFAANQDICVLKSAPELWLAIFVNGLTLCSLKSCGSVKPWNIWKWHGQNSAEN